MNAYSGQAINISRPVLDGGIKGVIEWVVYRKKNDEAYTLIDIYNLVTANDYIAPDDEIEGSVGTYNFSYITEIPESSEDDQFQYKFISNDRPDIFIERKSVIYTIILLSEQRQSSIINGIIVAV